MKLAIIGSRTLTDIDISAYIPPDVTEIISGGAKGIDTLAEVYADKHKLSKYIIRPEYQKYPPKVAPMIRNKLIVDHCDALLAFWDKQSKGTLSTIDYANKIGKTVTVVELEKD
ncbi:MAG: hypothetical protein R3Y63_06615 [Eubacteriales bacterium]